MSVKAGQAQDLAIRLGAEDTRALRAEKQRVYSECRGSIDDLFVAADQLRNRTTGAVDLASALGAMYRATAAVKLIAPGPLGDLANTTARAMAETATANAAVLDADNKVYNNRQSLYRLMREDLSVDERAGSAS